MITLRKKHRKSWVIFVIMFIGALLILSCDASTDLDKSDDKGPLGEWKITELTGSIQNIRETGVPLLCDAFNETYHPILGEDKSYISFVKLEDEPDFEHIPSHVFDSYQLDNDGLVFIFFISFDNGYYTNDVLESLGVQASYEAFLGSAWSSEIGIYSESDIAIADAQGYSESGTTGGGHSVFQIQGNLISDTQIEGTWSYSDTTAWPDINTPECDSHASGSGTWTAVKK